MKRNAKKNNNVLVICVVVIVLLIVGIICFLNCNKKEEYKFNVWYSFAQHYKINNSNSEIVEVKEENVTNTEIEGGGISLEISVIPKKAGQAKITYDVLNEYEEIISTKTYDFIVDENLKVTLNKYENAAKFREARIFSQTHRLSIADETIVSVSEKPLEQNPNIETGGQVIEYTLTAQKAGETTITLDILNDDGSINYSKTYNFIVDDNLEISFYEITE